MLTCGECGCAITAQWATGKCGGKYRYYRCTKKKGNCSQKYLREDLLAEQLKTRLQKIALCDEWVNKFLRKVGEWEKEETSSSQNFIQNLETRINENRQKLDKLISAYIDGDIPKENYLKKKEELMRKKLFLNQQKEDFGQKGKNWIEPLRNWILDMKKANKLASSDNFYEIKEFVQKVGTNPQLFNKSVSFSFCSPFDFLASRLARSRAAEPQARRLSPAENLPSFEMWTQAESNCHLRNLPA